MAGEAPRRVALTEAEFYKVVALLRHLEVLRLEAREQLRLLEQRLDGPIAAAARDGKAFLAVLGERHGFDPQASWAFDERTFELVEEPEKPQAEDSKS